MKAFRLFFVVAAAACWATAFWSHDERKIGALAVGGLFCLFVAVWISTLDRR